MSDEIDVAKLTPYVRAITGSGIEAIVARMDAPSDAWHDLTSHDARLMLPLLTALTAAIARAERAVAWREDAVQLASHLAHVLATHRTPANTAARKAASAYLQATIADTATLAPSTQAGGAEGDNDE